MSDVARKYLPIYVTENICGLTLQGVPNKQLNYVRWQHKINSHFTGSNYQGTPHCVRELSINIPLNLNRISVYYKDDYSSIGIGNLRGLQKS